MAADVTWPHDCERGDILRELVANTDHQQPTLQLGPYRGPGDPNSGNCCVLASAGDRRDQEPATSCTRVEDASASKNGGVSQMSDARRLVIRNDDEGRHQQGKRRRRRRCDGRREESDVFARSTRDKDRQQRKRVRAHGGQHERSRDGRVNVNANKRENTKRRILLGFSIDRTAPEGSTTTMHAGQQQTESNPFYRSTSISNAIDVSADFGSIDGDDDGAVEVVPVKVISAFPASSWSWSSAPADASFRIDFSDDSSANDDDDGDEEAQTGTAGTNNIRRRTRTSYKNAAALRRERAKLVASVGNTVSGTGFALILAGLITAALGVYGYTISGGGRYYLGFGLFSGVTTSLAGCAGLKAGRKFGDKHSVRGYVVLVGFSLLTTCGLLLLSYLAIVRHPGRVVDALAGSTSCLACLVAMVDTLALALCCCYQPPSSSSSKSTTTTRRRRRVAAIVASSNSGTPYDRRGAKSSNSKTMSDTLMVSSSSTAHLVDTPPSSSSSCIKKPISNRFNRSGAAVSVAKSFRRNSMKAKRKIFEGVVIARDKIGDLVSSFPPMSDVPAAENESGPVR